MALTFLADHCVSSYTIQTLQSKRHQVVRLREVCSPESPDALVIAKAQELDAILLSLNGDFADIVRYPPKNYKGIIALQMRNHPEILPSLLTRLAAYLELHPDGDQYVGKLLVIEVDRIRIRQ
jgi:predicted nuclease of predicted toxin-antitoxin system